MSNFEQILNTRLQTPVEQPAIVESSAQESSPAPFVMTVTDRANLITNVYTEMGIFDSSLAERAPDMLIPDLEALEDEYPGTEPFVVIDLTESFGVFELILNYKKRYESTETFAFISPWRRYDLNQLNRRSVGGDHEPTPNTVRGRLPGVGVQGLNIIERRYNAKDMTLLNLTDYVLTHAMRLEAGLPYERVATGFIQLDEMHESPEGISLVKTYVGAASLSRGELDLTYLNAMRNRNSGPRISVGLGNQV